MNNVLQLLSTPQYLLLLSMSGLFLVLAISAAKQTVKNASLLEEENF